MKNSKMKYKIAQDIMEVGAESVRSGKPVGKAKKKKGEKPSFFRAVAQGVAGSMPATRRYTDEAVNELADHTQRMALNHELRIAKLEQLHGIENDKKVLGKTVDRLMDKWEAGDVPKKKKDKKEEEEKAEKKDSKKKDSKKKDGKKKDKEKEEEQAPETEQPQGLVTKTLLDEYAARHGYVMVKKEEEPAEEEETEEVYDQPEEEEEEGSYPDDEGEGYIPTRPRQRRIVDQLEPGERDE